MPTLGPFRALRYDPAVIGDVAAVICPPYDVISRAEREHLLARHPRNIVRVELPVPPGGPVAAGGDDPYASAAGYLRSWRHEAALRLDEEPALYAYEARYRLPGDAERAQRGFFARLRLEPLGSGIRPHERTLSAPKEDRLRLLRATGADTSPIVLLVDPAAGDIGHALVRIADRDSDTDAVDDASVRHRLWVVPAGSREAAVLLAAGTRPLTIADGHHRYETALRYRDERRAERGSRALGGPAEDLPEDHVLALVLAPGEGRGGASLLVLPTHRLVRGDASVAAGAVELAQRFFTVRPRHAEDLVAAYSPPYEAAPGRLGLLTAQRAYELEPRPERIGPLFDPATPAPVRALDVAILEAVLRASPTSGSAVHSVAAAETLGYTHDAREALGAVESGEAAVAFLLAPTPLASVLAVAAAGALMPQKSTYFYPKVATGLVIYPLE